MVIYSVIHKRVFTPPRDLTTRIIEAIDHFSNSTMAFTKNFTSRIFCKCKCHCWVWRMIDSLYYSSRKISERCENSFVNYRINYQKLCYSLRRIWTQPMHNPCSPLLFNQSMQSGSTLYRSSTFWLYLWKLESVQDFWKSSMHVGQSAFQNSHQMLRSFCEPLHSDSHARVKMIASIIVGDIVYYWLQTVNHIHTVDLQWIKAHYSTFDTAISFECHFLQRITHWKLSKSFKTHEPEKCI